MLITPRTSAADCESLMRAAMSECSVRSMAWRSQQAASVHGNTLSIGASTNGTQALRMVASTIQSGSAESSEAAVPSAPAAYTSQRAGSARSLRQQQQEQGQQDRPRSVGQAEETQASQTGVTVSAEASEVRPEHSKVSYVLYWHMVEVVSGFLQRSCCKACMHSAGVFDWQRWVACRWYASSWSDSLLVRCCCIDNKTC